MNNLNAETRPDEDWQPNFNTTVKKNLWVFERNYDLKRSFGVYSTFYWQRVVEHFSQRCSECCTIPYTSALLDSDWSGGDSLSTTATAALQLVQIHHRFYGNIPFPRTCTADPRHNPSLKYCNRFSIVVVIVTFSVRTCLYRVYRRSLVHISSWMRKRHYLKH